MNRSKQWTVRHEPLTHPAGPRSWRHVLPVDAERLNSRFQQDYYGEVNSYLRHALYRLDVGRRGVIIRSPRDIWISAINHRVETTRAAVDVISLGLLALHEAIRAGAFIIIFEEMTTDATYLRGVLRIFGIEDVEPTSQLMQKKVNAAPRRVKRYTDINAHHRKIFQEQTDWFTEQYYGENG